MFPADDNENQQLLSHESRKSIELCTKIRKQFQQAVLEGHREQQVMNVVDLMEEMQRGWRAASGENVQLREQNGRLKRQIENFETALAEARVENQRLNSQHAADEELIGSLQLELDQYKERFNRARLEIQNAGLEIGIGMPPTDQPQKKVTPADEDTTEEDDDENVFLAQQPTNHGPKDGLPPLAAGGGDRARRRRSNSVGVLSDKQPLDFLSPFPVNPPKLVLGPLFVPSAAANSANRMPTPKMSVQKSPPPQSKQMHQNHQLTPVSTRPRHRIPVRIGGTPPSRRKWGGGGRENGEGNDGEQQYPPPSSEPRGKSFKYRLTPYSPASSIFCRQQQHRHNNRRMASPIPINFSTGSATLPPPPPPLSSKQQPKPMKTILTTLESGGPAPAALPPLMEPTNPTNAGGGITLGSFLSNGDGQNAGQGEQQQESSTEKQYLPSIRPKLPAQWKQTLGKLY